MSPRWLNIFRRGGRRENGEAPLTVEEVKADGGGVEIQLSFERSCWERLEESIRARGLAPEKSLPLLMEYGVDEPKSVPSMTERLGLGGRYSSLRYRLFECLQDNKAMAAGLSVHLKENRRLKQKLAESKGERYVPRNEWDEWDAGTVERIQAKYLFVGSS